MYSEKKCIVCGNLFIPKQGRQICCSKKCSGKRKYAMYVLHHTPTRKTSMEILQEMVRDNPEYGKIQATETLKWLTR